MADLRQQFGAGIAGIFRAFADFQKPCTIWRERGQDKTVSADLREVRNQYDSGLDEYIPQERTRASVTADWSEWTNTSAEPSPQGAELFFDDSTRERFYRVGANRDVISFAVRGLFLDTMKENPTDEAIGRETTRDVLFQQRDLNPNELQLNDYVEVEIARGRYELFVVNRISVTPDEGLLECKITRERT